MSIEIKKALTTRDRQQMLLFRKKVYGNDPLWVPQAIPEQLKVMDPDKGTFFQRGTAEYFTVWRGGEMVGTICAAEDSPKNEQRGTRDCIIGYLEYIQDYEVFTSLMDRAETWAEARGLTSLFGPFNLDYEDSYGVLVEGRDRPPALLCGHTPAYYQTFMERYGFTPAQAQNVALAVNLDEPKVDRLIRVAERLKERGRITVREGDFSRWDEEVDTVHRLLNTALGHLNGFSGWRWDDLENLLEPFRQFADPQFILFADVDDRTVGFFPGIPNWNEALIHANGLQYPWDYLKLWWHSRRQPECLAVKSVLVEPEFWNRGVIVMLAAEMLERARKAGYRWADLSITSMDNPMTVLMGTNMGAEIYKRWQVYRKMI